MKLLFFNVEEKKNCSLSTKRVHEGGGMKEHRQNFQKYLLWIVIEKISR